MLQGVVGVPDAAGERPLEHSSVFTLEARAVNTFGVTLSFGPQIQREEHFAQRARILPQLTSQR